MEADMEMAAFLEHPPWWVAAAVVAILTHHAVEGLIRVATKSRRNHTIQILELFIVLVLGFLTVHAYYGESANTAHETDWADKPFALVVALALFGLGSVALYLVAEGRRAGPSARGRTRRRTSK